MKTILAIFLLLVTSSPIMATTLSDANGIASPNMIERAKKMSDKLTIDQLCAIAKGAFSTQNVAYKELGRFKGYTYYLFETTDLPDMRCIIRDDGAMFDAASYTGKRAELGKLKPYSEH